ncbi:peptidoglycan-binding protein [Streptomyces sp. NL15-2K]|uniref:peptidoglycan-binding protein n=1 Tax=Streptomyces sp. NL15-2K TaxID=376149 RepID=UPI000F577012|nr:MULTISPECIES: peptidoglycan-binding protein [Actinomycetes]WKX09429.1 peptidoglycan-binding protein [Kutzneria buriramensis]GCB49063.1 hypothetical protein SNL152K_6394 [Streptomyces sp. NL15-2K]
MATPVFEEFDPASDCDCPGCVHWRRVLLIKRARTWVAAKVQHRTRPVGGTAGVKPGFADPATPDPVDPVTPDPVDPVTPDSAIPAAPAGAPTPYPGAAYFGPGANNEYVTQLGRMLVERGAGRHYPCGPGPRWSDADRRATRAFQQAQGRRGRDADGLPGPRTWALLVTGQGRDITAGSATPSVPASHGVPGYPGRALFRPGANNEYVTRLGRQLVRKGFGTYCTTGPGPRWGEADRRGVEAFQRAQGWRGGAADGYPGPETWRRLFS